MALYPLVSPPAVGAAAFDVLSDVPWSRLEFAYNHHEFESLIYDVEATLRAVPADWRGALEALYSNIFHQRTVYEATAYAVPFLVAYAAGPDVPAAHRIQLVILLSDIALSASFTTDDGTRAGAFGEGVDDAINKALLGSTARFDAIAALDPSVADVFPAIVAIATEPSKDRAAALVAINQRLFAALQAMEPAAPAEPVSTLRYRHPKLGDAVLVRRQENGLLLRFDDGKERVILEKFVTLIG